MSPFKNRHIVHASLNALSGVAILLREKSAKRELVVLVIAISAFIYSRDVYSFLLVLLALMMLAVEALNTAIEALADEVSPNYSERIKAAKDLGAAAVVILVIAFGFTFLMFAVMNVPVLHNIRDFIF